MGSKKVLSDADIGRFLQSYDDDFEILDISEDENNNFYEISETENAFVAEDNVKLLSEFSDEKNIPLMWFAQKRMLLGFLKQICTEKNFINDRIKKENHIVGLWPESIRLGVRQENAKEWKTLLNALNCLSLLKLLMRMCNGQTLR